MKEWWTPAELAELGLPDLPSSREEIARLATNGGWRDPAREYPTSGAGLWRKRAGKGGGYEYRMDVLPVRARAQLALRQRRALDAKADKTPKTEERNATQLWRWFEGLTEARQAKGYDRQKVLLAVRDATVAGMRRDDAVHLVAAQAGVRARTIYNWLALVAGVAVAHWPAHLAPQHAGRQATAAYDDAAWEFFRDAYLRQSQPSAAKCYRDLEAVARERGWTLPSRKTLERRLATVPATQRVLRREGKEALKKLFPAQRRDRTMFHALQAVNSDGHEWDVRVEWPDGYIGRPIMVGFQDLYSDKILSFRVDKTEHWDLVRLAFCDLVETWGVPEKVWLDNGRAFASKGITGGQKSRYRFKVKADDPEGIMTALGCEVHWTKPYSGQSKPIERAWKDLAANIARDIRFEGAWTGNTIANKPENYGSRAIPLETFLAVVAEGIAEHNARTGRRTRVCGGRLSFDEAFEESYAQSLITKPTEAQLRKLLLTSEAVTARRPDGAVFLAENRYWAEFLTEYVGRKLMLRFDPQALHAGVHVYRLDGAYLGAAACVDDTGFADTSAGRAHERIRRAFLKHTREAARLQQRFSLDEMARMLPKVEPAAPAAPKVVRPLFGRTATAGNAALKLDHDQEAVLADFGEAVRRMPGVAHIFAPKKEGGAEE